MKQKFSIVLALLLLATVVFSGATALQAAKTAKLHGVRITVMSSDKLRLYGWCTASPHDKAPLWVLLPMMGHTHSSYNPFIKKVYDRFKTPDTARTLKVMPNILALDLRGHGESVNQSGATINYRSMEPEDFAPYPQDVVTMINAALTNEKLKINKTNIVIIGASIGANTSVMTAGQVEGGVRKVVMLSPGESYRSLEPATALAEFNGEVLIFAAEEDSYSKTSSEKLFDANKKKCTLKIYEGPYHGTDLIDNSADAMNDLIDWLVK